MFSFYEGSGEFKNGFKLIRGLFCVYAAPAPLIQKLGKSREIIKVYNWYLLLKLYEIILKRCLDVRKFKGKLKTKENVVAEVGIVKN